MRFKPFEAKWISGKQLLDGFKLDLIIAVYSVVSIISDGGI